MVKPSARERVGRVAILAFIAGLRMVCSLPCGFNAIMAADAALRNAHMIKPADRPLTGGVTAVAFGLCDNMIGRLTIGSHIIVATGAIARCSLEDRSLVARFARDDRVRARQGETR
jgi:hypothetical protein